MKRRKSTKSNGEVLSLIYCFIARCLELVSFLCLVSIPVFMPRVVFESIGVSLGLNGIVWRASGAQPVFRDIDLHGLTGLCIMDRQRPLMG